MTLNGLTDKELGDALVALRALMEPAHIRLMAESAERETVQFFALKKLYGLLLAAHEQDLGEAAF